MEIYSDHASAPEKIFVEFLSNCNVSYFNNGRFGVGFKASLKPENSSYTSPYSILSLHNTQSSLTCNTLFIKVCIILPTDEEMSQMGKDIYDIHVKLNESIDSVTQTEFMQEIANQVDIYKQSNHKLEPLCPPVLYSKVLQNTTSVSLHKIFNIMTDNYTGKETDLKIIDHLIPRYNCIPDYYKQYLKVGIIAMPFAEQYVTLHSLNTSPMYDYYKLLAVYEMIRLYKIGYYHGDLHQNNILINPNYVLQGNSQPLGKCILIDFGRTYKHKNPIFSYKIALHDITQTCHKPFGKTIYDWHSHEWFGYYHNILVLLLNSLKKLEKNLEIFQNREIRLLSKKYSTIINKIQRMNNSPNTTNTLEGGRLTINSNIPIMDKMDMDMRIDKKMDKMDIDKKIFDKKIDTMDIDKKLFDKKIDTMDIDKKMDMDVPVDMNNVSTTQIELTKDVLDDDEFEKQAMKLFNPDNIDMNAILEKYIYTINSGIQRGGKLNKINHENIKTQANKKNKKNKKDKKNKKNNKTVKRVKKK